jgi:8-amino-7-oxononanoate synthase
MAEDRPQHDRPARRDPLAWVDRKLSALEHRCLLRQKSMRTGAQRATIEIDGRTLINFGSNDYLALASDARLAHAASQAIAEGGVGAGASPLVTGRSNWHHALEERLAEFLGAEAALAFTSGYVANVATIAALAGREDVIFSDAKNHASIIDGCRLSGAHTAVYRHGDAEHLAEMLVQNAGADRKLIVTDTVFSMDGDIAPLCEIADLAARHDAMLMVDEAHATGVFGERGRGVVEQLGLGGAIDVHVGTLSKALGCAGGFVAGSRRLVDWLFNRARGYVFSTAPPAALCAAACQALEIVRDEPQRRQELLALADKLRAELSAAGFDTGNSASQIVPIRIGDALQAMLLSAALKERGLFVPGIRPPTVPPGESLLRVSLSFGHTAEHVKRLVEALVECRRQCTRRA